MGADAFSSSTEVYVEMTHDTMSTSDHLIEVDFRQKIVNKYGVPFTLFRDFINAEKSERLALLKAHKDLDQKLRIAIRERDMQIRKNRAYLEKESNAKKIVISAEAWQDALAVTQMPRIEVDWPKPIQLPDWVLNNPYLITEFKALWGTITPDGLLAFDNPMLYKEKVAKIIKLWEYAEFLNLNSTPEAKLKKFVELLSTAKEFIKYKEFILMDYMKNIVEDLENQWEYLSTNWNGKYEIKSINQGWPIKWLEWLTETTIVPPKYLDFAILYWVSKSNTAILEKWREVNQKAFVNDLLGKYVPWVVKWNDVTNILSPWTPAKLNAKLQWLPRMTVQQARDIDYLEKIATKASWENPEDALESMFKNKKNVFNDLNTFTQTYSAKKGLIDFAAKNKIDLWKPLSDDNIWKLIASEAMRALPLVAVISILLFLWWKKNLAGIALIWTLGAVVWWRIAWRLQDKGVTSNPHEIDIKSASEFGVPAIQISSEQKYQDMYTTLSKENDQNHINNKTEWSGHAVVKDNMVLAAILKGMTKNQDVRTRLNAYNIADLNDDAKFGGVAKNIAGIVLWVGSTAWSPITPRTVAELWIQPLEWDGWQVTEEDVKNFLLLLKSQKEDGDRTVTDLLESGQFILNDSYAPVDVVWSYEISRRLDKLLLAEYNNWDEEKRTKIEEFQSEHELTIVSVAADAVTNAVKRSYNGSHEEEEKRIDTIIDNVGEVFWPKVAWSFSEAYIDELEDYKVYIKQEEELEKQDGFADETLNAISQFGTVKWPFTKPSDLLERISDLRENIKDLDAIKKALAWKEKIEPFKTMLETVKDLKDKQEEYIRKLEDKKNTWVLSLLQDKTLLATWTVDMATATLNSNPGDFLDQVKASQSEAAVLLGSSNDIRLEDSAQAMKDYGAVILRQDANYKAYNAKYPMWMNPSSPLPSWDPERTTTVQLRDYHKLARAKLKTKLEKPLLAFYKANNTQQTELAKITLWVWTSKVGDDLKILNATKKYLWKEWVALDTAWENALKLLIEKIKKERDALKLKIANAKKVTTPNTTQITKWEQTVQFFDKATTSIWNTATTAGAWTSVQYDLVDNSVTSLMNTLSAATLDDTLIAFKTGVEDAFFETKAYITEKKKDDVAIAATKKWGEVFPGTFLTTLSAKSSLKNVADSYEKKRQEVKVKIGKEVDDIAALNLVGMAVPVMKEKYRRLNELKKHGDSAWLLETVTKGKIKNAQDYIVVQYNSLHSIGQASIDTDLKTDFTKMLGDRIDADADVKAFFVLNYWKAGTTAWMRVLDRAAIEAVKISDLISWLTVPWNKDKVKKLWRDLFEAMFYNI